MYWRRFAVKDIPISDPEKFELWLRERWIEKDVLLEYYVANGAFPEDDVPKEDGAIDEKPSGLRKRVTVGGKERIVTTSGGTDRDGKWGGPVETEVKIAGWGDVLSIFSALGYVDSPSLTDISG